MGNTLSSENTLQIIQKGICNLNFSKTLKDLPEGFKDENAVNRALWNLVDDDYALKMIAKWVDEKPEDTATFETYLLDAEELGTFKAGNGAIFKSNTASIVLEKCYGEEGYCVDKKTKLPFKIKSVTLKRDIQ